MLKKTITNSDYRLFKDFLEKQSGISLGDNKQYLVSSRLAPVMEKYQLSNLTDIIHRVMESKEYQLRNEVIDAMTTNETLWFRDNYPFENLKDKLFPELSQHSRQLKIWSAACSSGQEPYSLAMTVLEYRQTHPHIFNGGISILGTDLSSAMLDKGRMAKYGKLAIARNLSESRKQIFFKPDSDGNLCLNQQVKNLVTFKIFNLLDCFLTLGHFDIIFCRNVLIYFAPEAKQRILRQFAAVLNPGGALFLGASEFFTEMPEDFKLVRCNPGIYYQKTRN